MPVDDQPPVTILSGGLGAGKTTLLIVIIVTVYRINRMQSCGRSRNDSQ